MKTENLEPRTEGRVLEEKRRGLQPNGRILEAASREAAMRQARRHSAACRTQGGGCARTHSEFAVATRPAALPPVHRERLAGPALEDDGDRLAGELRSIKRTLATLEASTRGTQAAATLREGMLRAGFADPEIEAVSERVLDRATLAELRDARLLAARALGVLQGMLRLQPGLAHGTAGPRIYAFVGPAGCGKTSTLMKLAALYQRRGGRLAIASIPADADGRLRKFAEAGVLPLEIASTVEQAHSVRGKFADYEMLLVDTAGGATAEEASETALLVRELAADEVLLVIEAGMLGDLAERACAAYGRFFEIDRVIVSKLDQSVRIGAAVSIACRLGCPIAYLATGPRVPDDLRAAGAASIGRLLSKSLEAGA